MRKSFILIFFALFSYILHAETELAKVSFQAMDMGIGAKAVSMGNVYTAVSDDSSAIYWNVAGIARVNKPEISLSYNKWIMDTSYQYITGALPIGRGGFGISAAYVNMGILDEIDEDGYFTGETLNPYSFNASVGYANNLFDYYSMIGQKKPEISFIIGSALKMAVEYNGYAYISSFVFDFGIMAIVRENITVGMTLHNFSIVSELNVPSTFKVGIAWRVIRGFKQELLVTADARQRLRGGTTMGAGLEYGFLQHFYVRTGYDHDPKYVDLEGFIRGINGGVGISFGSIDIDYGLSTDGPFGVNHIVTFTYKSN